MLAEMPETNGVQMEFHDPEDPEVNAWYLASQALDEEGGFKEDEFGRLFSGDWSAWPSQSEADLVLTKHLARMTTSNTTCWQAFQLSGLGKRDKANRADYMRSTLATARSHLAKEDLDIAQGREIAERLLSRLSPSASSRTGHFKVLSDSDLACFPVQRWIVKGIIPAEGIGAIYGPPGSGKSFLSLDLLAHVANGERWFGRRVCAVPVVYVPFEGQAGIPKRIRAWKTLISRQANREVDSGIRFIFEGMNLRQRADRDKLVNTLLAEGLTGGVLCIDTLAQSGPGIDENSSEGMGEMIAIFNELRSRLGGVVLVVHHTGKDSERGLRGWSGLAAAMDFSIECQLGKGKFDRKFVLAKVKDDEAGRAFEYTLLKVHLGFDVDGDELSSLAIIPPSLNESGGDHGDSLVERDIEDDSFIWNWVKKEVEAGNHPSGQSVWSQRAEMDRKLTQIRTRAAIHRLMAEGRLVYDEEKSPSGNRWIRAVSIEPPTQA
jgi:hypothetical protein